MLLQNLTQRQQLKILPQQIQLLNIFHLTTLELEQHIQMELENNPVLEEVADADAEKTNDETVNEYADWEEYAYDDIPDYKMEYANYFPTESIPEKPIADEIDFRKTTKEQLKWQIEDTTKYNMAVYLVDSLNDSGYLDLPLEKIAENISFSEKRWIEASDLIPILNIIQQLDPPGIGACSLQESFLLQLARMNQCDWRVTKATQLLTNYYNNLGKKELSKIKQDLQLSDENLEILLDFIASLQFRPINNQQHSEVVKQYITPDFIITVEDEDIKISLYKQRAHTLFINNSWVDSIQNQMRSKDKSGKVYLQNKLRSAEWFVSAIQQREHTMVKVMEEIVNWQREYFLSGDILQIKPMILKNIADLTGVDISTVSRITSNKYAQTPYGNILLKFLFSEGVKDLNGDIVSARVIQKALKDAIDQEDKNNPYTDYQLVSQLAECGFKLARRTVAKYREILRIPTAHLRRIWNK